MAKVIFDGGPAFPKAAGTWEKLHQADGMRLRDWFAGQALPMAWEYSQGLDYRSTEAKARDIAEMAYAVADAMLEARTVGGRRDRESDLRSMWREDICDHVDAILTRVNDRILGQANRVPQYREKNEPAILVANMIAQVLNNEDIWPPAEVEPPEFPVYHDAQGNEHAEF